MEHVWQWFCGEVESARTRVALFFLAFSESSFFLIPPDALLLAMLSAGAGRWLYLAWIASIGSIFGAVFGYMLGLLLFEPVVVPILSWYGLHESFMYIGARYEAHVFSLVLLAAFTPIPFKVFVLAGGFFQVAFLPFIIGSTIGRTARFVLVAWVGKKYGPQTATFLLHRVRYVTYALIAVGVIAGIFWFL